MLSAGEEGRIDRGSPAESAIFIDQILKSLEPRQRRTIEFVYYDGLTAEEVSIRTGETVRVVRHNLYRGLERLRRNSRDSGVCDSSNDKRRKGAAR